MLQGQKDPEILCVSFREHVEYTLAIRIVFSPVGVKSASSSRPDGLATLANQKGPRFHNRGFFLVLQITLWFSFKTY
jgi:hypothetical protein